MWSRSSRPTLRRYSIAPTDIPLSKSCRRVTTPCCAAASRRIVESTSGPRRGSGSAVVSGGGAVASIRGGGFEASEWSGSKAQADRHGLRLQPDPGRPHGWTGRIVSRLTLECPELPRCPSASPGGGVPVRSTGLGPCRSLSRGGSVPVAHAGWERARRFRGARPCRWGLRRSDRPPLPAARARSGTQHSRGSASNRSINRTSILVRFMVPLLETLSKQGRSGRSGRSGWSGWSGRSVR
jgi:hypothetical protein